MGNSHGYDFDGWLRSFMESEGVTTLKPWLAECLWAAWLNGYGVGFEEGNIEADESREEH